MISVIIPCYNCSGFIDRCVQSVLRQTYLDVEIILVNNNSTDNSLRILKSYASAHPQKVFVYEEFKKGAPAARNHGLSKSKGSWIQFLDADDELLPDKLQRQMEIAQIGNADVIAGDCLLKYTTATGITEIVRHVDQNPWKGLITSNLGITSSNLWSKQCLLDVNGWDETLTSSQEYNLLFSLLKNKAKIVSDNHINTVVHFSGNSVSKSSNKEKIAQILNNRINLRLDIKKVLQQDNLLTPELDIAIDNYLYTEIMSYYHLIPQHASELLRRYKPKVKFSKALKLKTKVLIKYVRSFKML